MILKLIIKYLLPKKQRQKVLSSFINYFMDTLGKDEFVSKLLESAERTFKVKESKKYNTTEEEVDHELEDYPQLIPYKLYFVHTLRNLRVKHGLNP